MKKLLLVIAALSAISGCANQTKTLEQRAFNPDTYLRDGSLLVSIDHFEVEKGTTVALMSYVDYQDRLCFQWVSSAKKTQNKITNQSSIETTISIHCGEYEARETINPLLGTSSYEPVSTDIRAE